jgi:purine-nucleoside phosphorylase
MFQHTKQFLEQRMPARPAVCIVLGSGLSDFTESLAGTVELTYSEIPGWPRSTAVGHAGKLIFGSLDGINVVVLSGRVHLYEGYSAARVTFPIRILKLLGVRALVLTNAAGGINPAYQQGALVLISDHINLQGSNPLAGANEDDFGPRFPDMSAAYDPGFRAIAHESASELGIDLMEGVYAAVLGPSYETPAEIRYLRTIGADLVGMSTAPEVIVANHMSMRVLAISCVTNMAAGMLPKRLSHEEVLETGRRVSGTLFTLLRSVVPKLAGEA